MYCIRKIKAQFHDSKWVQRRFIPLVLILLITSVIYFVGSYGNGTGGSEAPMVQPRGQWGDDGGGAGGNVNKGSLTTDPIGDDGDQAGDQREDGRNIENRDDYNGEDTSPDGQQKVYYEDDEADFDDHAQTINKKYDLEDQTNDEINFDDENVDKTDLNDETNETDFDDETDETDFDDETDDENDFDDETDNENDFNDDDNAEENRDVAYGDVDRNIPNMGGGDYSTDTEEEDTNDYPEGIAYADVVHKDQQFEDEEVTLESDATNSQQGFPGIAQPQQQYSPQDTEQVKMELVKVDTGIQDESVNGKGNTETVNEEELWDKDDTDLNTEADDDSDFNDYIINNNNVIDYQNPPAVAANQPPTDNVDDGGVQNLEESQNREYFHSQNDDDDQFDNINQNVKEAGKVVMPFEPPNDRLTIDGGFVQDRKDNVDDQVQLRTNDFPEQQEGVAIIQHNIKIIPILEESKKVDSEKMDTYNNQQQGVEMGHSIWEIGDRGPMAGDGEYDKLQVRVTAPLGQHAIDEQQDTETNVNVNQDPRVNDVYVKQPQLSAGGDSNGGNSNEDLRFQNQDIGHGGPGWVPVEHQIQGLLSQIRLVGQEDHQGSQDGNMQIDDHRQQQIKLLLNEIETNSNNEQQDVYEQAQGSQQGVYEQVQGSQQNVYEQAQGSQQDVYEQVQGSQQDVSEQVQGSQQDVQPVAQNYELNDGQVEQQQQQPINNVAGILDQQNDGYIQERVHGEPINNVAGILEQQNDGDLQESVQGEPVIDERQLQENKMNFINAVHRIADIDDSAKAESVDGVNQVPVVGEENMLLQGIQSSQNHASSSTFNTTEVSKILQIELSQATPIDSRSYKDATVLTKVPPIKFLSHYKNPCWYEQSSESGDTVLRCLPYFFITGIPGWGVERLLETILLHQQIASPLNTKPNWWSQQRIIAQEAFGTGYLDNFDLVAQTIRHFITRQDNAIVHEKITFDASPELLFPFSLWNRYGSYMEDPQNQHFFTPYQVKSILPQAKFVVLVSNPVDRLYRWYNTEFNDVPSLLKTPTDFNARVEGAFRKIFNCTKTEHQGSHICHFAHTASDGTVDTFLKEVQCGFYGYILQQWYNVFPSNSILIVPLEAIQKDTVNILNSIFYFLQLERPSLTVQEVMKAKTADLWRTTATDYDINYAPMLDTTRHLLQSMYKQSDTALASHLGWSQMVY